MSRLGEDGPRPAGEMWPWASVPRAFLRSVDTTASHLVRESHARVCLCACVRGKVCVSPFLTCARSLCV